MASSSGGRSAARSLGTTVLGVAVGFVLVVALAGALLMFRGHDSGAGGSGSTPSSTNSSVLSVQPDIPEPSVDAATLAKLPRADTFGTVRDAPVDLDAASHGKAVHISSQLVGFKSPGADPITVIPPDQFGDQTWLPVIGSERGWLQVRLPARPNGATAWIARGSLPIATTAWSVHLALGSGTMTISKAGVVVGSWKVGIGKDNTPTPIGQTFLLASFVDPKQSFSPVIYATGSHSDTLDSFGGGPGTVAVHGWPTQSGRIGQVSHGCVRVPGDALAEFAKLPAATPINITS